MTSELPFQPVEPWTCEPLMSVDEIEEFSPAINSDLELPDDAKLEDSLAIPGGLAAYCHRQRLIDQEAGLSGINHLPKEKIMTTYRRPGVESLGNGPTFLSTDAIAEWTEALEAKMKTGLSKPDAIKAVIKNNPDLHRRFIEEHNAKVGPSSFRGSTL